MQTSQFWQATAAALLARHYGLTLNDTDLCDDLCVETLQKAGIKPFEAINDLVDKYHLTHLTDSAYLPRSPYLSAADELIAGLEAGATLGMISHP
ncbi:TA system toxin CbtA family protein [Rahnella sp. ChDrAdgB13]|uniref:TA system toxin CbtA family protein n=1 Tax=Rahnella sp. ChDrAdgB13 TaxID=1850581 RepID=UPI001AD890A0|nr:TA system toxin CbtA family protein [Rahnella sp. ChDrAdgB13]